MNELKTKIVLRNDTSGTWEAYSNRVLLKGEVGIEFTTDGKTKIKIGNGTSTWAQLDYFGGEVEAIEELIPEQASSANKLADKAFVNSTVQTSMSSKQDVLEEGTGIRLDGAVINCFGVETATGGIIKMWKGTQAEYEALSSYDDDTLYIVRN